MLTKAQLEKDKAGLEQQREQLIAQLNAVSGALKYVTDKLEEIEKAGVQEEKENGRLDVLQDNNTGRHARF